MKLAPRASLHEPGTGAKPLPGFFICAIHLTMYAEKENKSTIAILHRVTVSIQ
jgi:hypothetical protein